MLRTKATDFADATAGLPAAPPGTTAPTVVALGAALTALQPLAEKSDRCRVISGNLTVIQSAQDSPLLTNTITDVAT